MSKISLETLNLNNNSNYKIVNVNNNEVKVKSYLPINDKINLVEEVIEKSLVQDAVYCNPILLKVMFELSVISYYSDINVGDLYEVNIMELYDLIKPNRVFEEVLSAIPKQEYEDLYDCLVSCRDTVEMENGSIINLIKAGMDKMSSIIEDSTEKLNQIQLDLGSDNLKNVLAIAKDNGAM